MLNPKVRSTNLVCVTACSCDDHQLIPFQEHLRAWLADPQGRDQYVTYRGDEVAVNWHGRPSQREVAHTRVVCFVPHSNEHATHTL